MTFEIVLWTSLGMFIGWCLSVIEALLRKGSTNTVKWKSEVVGPKVVHHRMLEAIDLSEVIMNFAFAIEDPCGLDEIKIARLSLEIARFTPPKMRGEYVRVLEHTLKVMKEGGSFENNARTDEPTSNGQ